MPIFLFSISEEQCHDQVEQLYHAYHKDMLRLAAYILRDNRNPVGIAEDAVQNAFIKIIRHLDKLNFDEKARMRAYVMAIVTNEARNLLQTKDNLSLELTSETELSDESFLEKLFLREQYDRVVDALMQLNDRYRIPMQLRYVEELSIPAIAKLLSLPIKTVYTNLRRGKIILLNILEGGKSDGKQ